MLDKAVTSNACCPGHAGLFVNKDQLWVRGQVTNSWQTLAGCYPSPFSVYHAKNVGQMQMQMYSRKSLVPYVNADTLFRPVVTMYDVKKLRKNSKVCELCLSPILGGLPMNPQWRHEGLHMGAPIMRGSVWEALHLKCILIRIKNYFKLWA